MSKEKMVVKPSYKIKIDNAGDYFSKVSRGVGITENKKKSVKNFRKEKHKKNLKNDY